MTCLSYIQHQSSSAANNMELEKLKKDYERSIQITQQWRKMYDNLHKFCVDEILSGDEGAKTKN